MTFTDSNGDTLGYMNETQSMMETYGMPEEYIEMVVNTYKENPQLNQTYYVSDIAYEMANRMGNVDDACKRLFETTDEYSKGMHGFVLKDGTIVLMPPGGDHNNITSINGVEDKWQFVEDGNPSILNNNLRVGDTLTYEQQIVIGRMIRCYSDDELFVDFLGGPKGEQTCRYIYPSYQGYSPTLTDITKMELSHREMVSKCDYIPRIIRYLCLNDKRRNYNYQGYH